MERLDMAQAALTAFALFSDKVAHQTHDRNSPSLILCHDGSGCIKELDTGHIYLEFEDLADLIHQVRVRI